MVRVCVKQLWFYFYRTCYFMKHKKKRYMCKFQKSSKASCSMFGSNRFRCNIVHLNLYQKTRLDEPITKSFSFAWIFSNMWRILKSKSFFISQQSNTSELLHKDGRPLGPSVFNFHFYDYSICQSLCQGHSGWKEWNKISHILYG